MKRFIVLLLIIIIILSSCGISTPSAIEHMKKGKDKRIELAQSNYDRFYRNPNKEFEVLVSLNKADYLQLPRIFEGVDTFISAFHYYDLENETVYGGYLDCNNKSLERIVNDYYKNVYNMLIGQIESQKSVLEHLYSIKDSLGNEIENNTNPEDITIDREIGIVEGSIKNLIEQMDAMDRGEFNIYGLRIKATGADIVNLLQHKEVYIVEILYFDKNNIVSPIK